MIDPTMKLRSVILDSLLLDTRPYMSCEECFDRLDTYVEGLYEDPTHKDLPMQVHLHACPACAEEADALMDMLSGRG